MTICEQIKKQYENIKKLTEEFSLEYEKAKESKNLTKIKELKIKLEQARQELASKLWVFEKLPQTELKEQYEKDKESLINTGILEKLSNNEYGVIGIDSQEYTYPTIENIAKRMMIKQEVLKNKIEQGFIKINITPIAQSLDKKIDIYRQKLWEHYKKRKLFATMKNLKDNPKFPDDLPFDDNTKKKIKKGELNYEDVWKDGGSYNENGDMYNNGNKAIWVWGKYKNADINNELVYYPEEFDKYDHKGKTKLELIKETEGTAFPGYIVTLHENMPNIPRKREGKTIGGREQLEAGEVITDYLKIMQTNNQYVNEIGQTPDEQIIYALQCLEQTNQVIDDYQGKGSVSYQLGAYFPAGGIVPSAYWNRGRRRVSLDRAVSEYSYSIVGLRSSVRVV